MGSVGNTAQIHLDSAVLPCDGFDLLVIDSDRSRGAKIPPFHRQIPILLCGCLRDERRFHCEFCLLVQVDPASRAAQGREPVIIIDTGHKLGRALAGLFLQLLLRQCRALGLLRGDHAKASRHLGRRHRRARKNRVASGKGFITADSYVVNIQIRLPRDFCLSGVTGHHTDSDPGDHIFLLSVFPLIDAFDHTGISVVCKTCVIQLISLLLRHVLSKKFMRLIGSLYIPLNVVAEHRPLTLIDCVEGAASPSLLESGYAGAVDLDRISFFITAGDRIDSAGGLKGVAHRCFDTYPAGVLR